MCGPFRTFFVPGHSATDTLLVNETDGYTIVGDHILETINPNPLLRPPRQAGAPRDKSLVQYQASLRRSRALDLGHCYPGHGPRFDDHRKVIDGLIHQHDRRNRKVLNLLGADSSTVYAMSRALYPDLPVQHLYLALSVAAGHLELLEQDGAVRVERRDGVLAYAAADC
ncbi:MAG: hypothetical protein IT368_14835 [Candidatus Hydrogenedentes bacterium]|nr:hypothetical protein [Candidatus Hydrogenedentota bacterium]